MRLVIILTLLPSLARSQIFQASAAAPLPKLMTVCDVLSSAPTRLNGKVVLVTGVFEESGEGMWLSGECNAHLTTKGLTWGNRLSVWIEMGDESVARSWHQADEKLTKLEADRSRDTIRMTILGRLETRATMDDEVVQMPYGLARAGFGHMGMSPAEIHVIRITGVSIERRRRDDKHPAKEAKP